MATSTNFYRNQRTLIPALVIGVLAAWCAFADPAITPGTANGARNYYANISKTFGFAFVPGVTTLSELLSFAGYPASGEKLESLDPEILMSPDRVASAEGLGIPIRALSGATLREGDILSARFFAPKIVNVNSSQPLPGWRKLVRLRARPDSRAARSGVESIVVLFNFLPAVGAQPFAGRSFNTQVMLLAPSQKDRLYWLDFDMDQRLALALNASFDAADLQSAGNRDYFVPDGCNACHGSPANFAPPMVNYLDTDHWFDRIEDDFKPLKESGTPIVFDAGTNDPSQPSFARAFDVIRRFNEEALAQNALVRSKSFEAEAARTWLKLHSESDRHFLPVERAFSMTGGLNWQVSEAEGLGKLNRYCFRCHGSVSFSIFDRAAVRTNAGNLQQRLKPNKQQAKRPGFKMPPDRDLATEEIQALYDFLGALR